MKLAIANFRVYFWQSLWHVTNRLASNFGARLIRAELFRTIVALNERKPQP